MTHEEAFHILGLEWSDKLSEEDIKRAYRNKVKQDHPDQGGNETELQKDKEAYEFLKSNGIKPQNEPDITNRSSTMDENNICLKCHGTGKVNKKETYRGRTKLVKIKCPRCRGKGYLNI